MLKRIGILFTVLIFAMLPLRAHLLLVNSCSSKRIEKMACCAGGVPMKGCCQKTPQPCPAMSSTPQRTDVVALEKFKISSPLAQFCVIEPSVALLPTLRENQRQVQFPPGWTLTPYYSSSLRSPPLPLA